MNKRKAPEKKRVLVAAGGTGGHLFPAQALADELLKKKETEVLFAGKGLAHNRYFHKERFAYHDIDSATPFKGGVRMLIRACWGIVLGIRQGLAVLREFQPDLVVGFGSYHTFPILAAALLKRVPIALFEPNSIPGKVNRFFSRFAVVSAVQFAEAREHLSGPAVEVTIPLWKAGDHSGVHVEQARKYFQLDPERRTLLVFGGSQGAASINAIVSKALAAHSSGVLEKKALQVIHVTGNASAVAEIEDCYRQMGLHACVKDFESQMEYAWRAADVAVCRAGAATLGELIAFEVPAVLIPFPKAADDHQTKNALFLQDQVGGGIHLPEHTLNVESFALALEQVLQSDGKRLSVMKQSIRAFKTRMQKKDLYSLIHGLLHET